MSAYCNGTAPLSGSESNSSSELPTVVANSNRTCQHLPRTVPCDSAKAPQKVGKGPRSDGLCVYKALQSVGFDFPKVAWPDVLFIRAFFHDCRAGCFAIAKGCVFEVYPCANGPCAVLLLSDNLTHCLSATRQNHAPVAHVSLPAMIIRHGAMALLRIGADEECFTEAPFLPLLMKGAQVASTLMGPKAAPAAAVARTLGKAQIEKIARQAAADYLAETEEGFLTKRDRKYIATRYQPLPNQQQPMQAQSKPTASRLPRLAATVPRATDDKAMQMAMAANAKAEAALRAAKPAAPADVADPPIANLPRGNLKAAQKKRLEAPQPTTKPLTGAQKRRLKRSAAAPSTAPAVTQAEDADGLPIDARSRRAIRQATRALSRIALPVEPHAEISSTDFNCRTWQPRAALPLDVTPHNTATFRRVPNQRKLAKLNASASALVLSGRPYVIDTGSPYTLLDTRRIAHGASSFELFSLGKTITVYKFADQLWWQGRGYDLIGRDALRNPEDFYNAGTRELFDSGADLPMTCQPAGTRYGVDLWDCVVNGNRIREFDRRSDADYLVVPHMTYGTVHPVDLDVELRTFNAPPDRITTFAGMRFNIDGHMVVHEMSRPVRAGAMFSSGREAAVIDVDWPFQPLQRAHPDAKDQTTPTPPDASPVEIMLFRFGVEKHFPRGKQRNRKHTEQIKADIRSFRPVYGWMALCELLYDSQTLPAWFLEAGGDPKTPPDLEIFRDYKHLRAVTVPYFLASELAAPFVVNTTCGPLEVTGPCCKAMGLVAARASIAFDKAQRHCDCVECTDDDSDDEAEMVARLLEALAVQAAGEPVVHTRMKDAAGKPLTQHEVLVALCAQAKAQVRDKYRGEVGMMYSQADDGLDEAPFNLEAATREFMQEHSVDDANKASLWVQRYADCTEAPSSRPAPFGDLSAYALMSKAVVDVESVDMTYTTGAGTKTVGYFGALLTPTLYGFSVLGTTGTATYPAVSYLSAGGSLVPGFIPPVVQVKASSRISLGIGESYTIRVFPSSCYATDTPVKLALLSTLKDYAGNNVLSAINGYPRVRGMNLGFPLPAAVAGQLPYRIRVGIKGSQYVTGSTGGFTISCTHNFLDRNGQVQQIVTGPTAYGVQGTWLFAEYFSPNTVFAVLGDGCLYLGTSITFVGVQNTFILLDSVDIDCECTADTTSAAVPYGFWNCQQLPGFAGTTGDGTVAGARMQAASLLVSNTTAVGYTSGNATSGVLPGGDPGLIGVSPLVLDSLPNFQNRPFVEGCFLSTNYLANSTRSRLVGSDYTPPVAVLEQSLIFLAEVPPLINGKASCRYRFGCVTDMINTNIALETTNTTSDPRLLTSLIQSLAMPCISDNPRHRKRVMARAVNFLNKLSNELRPLKAALRGRR